MNTEFELNAESLYDGNEVGLAVTETPKVLAGLTDFAFRKKVGYNLFNLHIFQTVTHSW